MRERLRFLKVVPSCRYVHGMELRASYLGLVVTNLVTELNACLPAGMRLIKPVVLAIMAERGGFVDCWRLQNKQ